MKGDATKKRPSTHTAHNLRALAAANVVRAASAMGILSVGGGDENTNVEPKKPAFLSAKRTSEEPRKVFSRS